MYAIVLVTVALSFCQDENPHTFGNADNADYMFEGMRKAGCDLEIDDDNLLIHYLLGDPRSDTTDTTTTSILARHEAFHEQDRRPDEALMNVAKQCDGAQMKPYVVGLIKMHLKQFFDDEKDLHKYVVDKHLHVDVKAPGVFAEKMLFRNAAITDFLRATLVLADSQYLPFMKKTLSKVAKHENSYVKNFAKRERWPYPFFMIKYKIHESPFKYKSHKSPFMEFPYIFVELQVIPYSAFKVSKETHEVIEEQRCDDMLKTLAKKELVFNIDKAKAFFSVMSDKSVKGLEDLWFLAGKDEEEFVLSDFEEDEEFVLSDFEEDEKDDD